MQMQVYAVCATCGDSSAGASCSQLRRRHLDGGLALVATALALGMHELRIVVTLALRGPFVTLIIIAKVIAAGCCVGQNGLIRFKPFLLYHCLCL